MIELTAADLSSEHLDKLASAAWEHVWMQPVRLVTFESVTDARGALIQRTIVFSNGTITTPRPHQLKIRVWP